MPVTSQHPDYILHLPDWRMMRDFAAGSRTVKESQQTYLPMPSGFRANSDGGTASYAAYILRGRVPELLLPTLAGMVGLIHRTDFKIEGMDEGQPLHDMNESATRHGLPLSILSQMITAELLLEGRYGLLADVAEEGADVPYIAGYTAEAIINWSPDRDLYVLDESTLDRSSLDDPFSWQSVSRYRVLTLSDEPIVAEPPAEGEEPPPPRSPPPEPEEDPDPRRLGRPMGTTYRQYVYETNRDTGETPLGPAHQPTVKGGKELEEIPFVVANPKDLSLDVHVPPLIGVALASLAAYQLDADYRLQLFMTGQETLFVFGVADKDVPSTVGATVVVSFPTEGKAEYVGPKGVGIEQHRKAIAEAKADAAAAGAQLFDQTDVPDESGKAKKLRYAAQTATLTSVAKASASALEAALRYCARFVGQDPDEIVVTPNLEFVDSEMTPQEALALVQVWQSGALSYESTYELLQRGRLASMERTAEEEQELIDQESPDDPMAGGDLGVEDGGVSAEPGQPAPGSERFIEDGEGLEIEEEDADDVTDEELERLFSPELLEG